MRGLSDSSDAQRLEKVIRNVEGVLQAEINYGVERAYLWYIPTIVSQSEIRKVINVLTVHGA